MTIALSCYVPVSYTHLAAGCSLYEITGGLNTGLAAALAEGQSAAIYDVCSKTMGGVGIALDVYKRQTQRVSASSASSPSL